MKKRFLALLLGGVMAVGCTLAIPATAQAADDPDDLKSESWQEWLKEEGGGCNGLSDTHIASSSVDVVNGLLTVTVNVQSASYTVEMCGGAVYVCEEEWEPASIEGLEDGKAGYDFFEWGPSAKASGYFWDSSTESILNGSTGSFKFTFEGLAVGKTYYVYFHIWDPHDICEAFFGSHYAVYLGSGAPTEASASGNNTSGSSSSSSSSAGSVDNNVAEEDSYIGYLKKLNSQIEAAPSGSTIVMEKGLTSLPNSTMKRLLAKGDVSLKMEFTYQNEEYVIIIPAGAALDNDISWYGPLYLAQYFGNKAGTADSETGETYEVQSGDCLSKIAESINMTLKQLLDKNPQIKNPNLIFPGQKINR